MDAGHRRRAAWLYQAGAAHGGETPCTVTHTAFACAPREQELEGRSARLVGDCLLGAAFLSYCGPFTHGFRAALLRDAWLPGVLALRLPVTVPFRRARRPRRG